MNSSNAMRYKGFQLYRVGISWYLVSPLEMPLYAGDSKVAAKDWIGRLCRGHSAFSARFGF